MGYYIRKRARLFPGIWLNLGQNGLSISAGFGMFRYRKRLTGKRKKKSKDADIDFYAPPEPTTPQYVGCAIYLIALVVLMVGLFAGFAITGLFIFIGGLALGSLIQIVGKTKDTILKPVEVTDETSLNKAVDVVNQMLALMDKDTDVKSLQGHYSIIKQQMAKLPSELRLNNMSLEDAKGLAFVQYADRLKVINQQPH